MNTLISFDEKGYLSVISQLNDIAELHLQQIVDDFNKINIGALQPVDFRRLFNKPAELVFEKMTGGELTLQGFKIDTVKAMEIIEKPAGYNELVASIKDTFEFLKSKVLELLNNTVTAGNVDTFFKLDETGKVVINDGVSERIDLQCRKFASSEKSKNMLSFSKAIVELYHSSGVCSTLSVRQFGSIGSLINNFIETNGNGELQLNLNAIEQLNR